MGTPFAKRSPEKSHLHLRLGPSPRPWNLLESERESRDLPEPKPEHASFPSLLGKSGSPMGLRDPKIHLRNPLGKTSRGEAPHGVLLQDPTAVMGWFIDPEIAPAPLQTCAAHASLDQHRKKPGPGEGNAAAGGVAGGHALRPGCLRLEVPGLRLQGALRPFPPGAELPPAAALSHSIPG